MGLRRRDVEASFPEFGFEGSAKDGTYKLCYPIKDAADRSLMLKISKDPISPKEQGDDPETEQELSRYEVPQRLQREIELMKLVTSPHVASIVAGPDVRTVGSREYVYYLEPHYPGGTLREKLGAPLDVEYLKTVGIQLFNAATAVNKAGAVHRDLKPSNVVFDAAGLLVVLDLGIAHMDDDDITTTHEFPMSRRYAAPEQFDPIAKGNIDQRADIFAIGIMLFEGLTGHHPYGSASDVGAYVDRLKRGDFNRPALAAIEDQAELKAAITRCLRPEPTARFRTTERARDALEACP